MLKDELSSGELRDCRVSRPVSLGSNMDTGTTHKLGPNFGGPFSPTDQALPNQGSPPSDIDQSMAATLRTLKQMFEPSAVDMSDSTEAMVQMSQAVSLKRIADDMLRFHVSREMVPTEAKNTAQQLGILNMNLSILTTAFAKIDPLGIFRK